MISKLYERLSVGGAAAMASSANMAALNSYPFIDGLPVKETLIGGSITSAIGFVGMALEYRRLTQIQLSPDPDDPDRDDLPDEVQDAELIPFPVHQVVDQVHKKAA
jgi:hypothetical protein